MHVGELDGHSHQGCFSFKHFFTPRPRAPAAKQSLSIANTVDCKKDPNKLVLNDHNATLGCDEIPVSFESCCDFSWSPSTQAYDPPPTYCRNSSRLASESDFMTTIGATIDSIDTALRSLSLNIHDHPELMFEERYAHDTLTDFMESRGFIVTREYLGLKTAWRAEFTHGKGGRTLGVNAEMDALPLIGHACGHNLIAASGVGVAIAIKSALKAHNVPGKVVLLGTPGEEGGGGKIILLERGGYNGMHACLMCHPSGGPAHSASTGSTLAMQSIDAEFFGHSAHAGDSPWEGTNALDAAFLAYSGVSVLRQQIKPDHRVHGIIQGSQGGANVIPDYARMHWIVRAPDRDQLERLRDRVEACFKGAATATGCRLKTTNGLSYYELRQNAVLGEYFSQTMSDCFGMDTRSTSFSASTDFGNVSYEMPSLHPAYAIPTQPNGGNHTPAFADSARSTEAHKACMTVTKGLAWTGFRLLADDQFYSEVRNEHQRAVGVSSAKR